jgi:hypothetical protein
MLIKLKNTEFLKNIMRCIYKNNLYKKKVKDFNKRLLISIQIIKNNNNCIN